MKVVGEKHQQRHNEHTNNGTRENCNNGVMAEFLPTLMFSTNVSQNPS